MSKSNRATATDVARAAGVSKWTVARAYTPGASIAEQSKERILQEAAKLGYRPNLLARSLATKTSNLVAVLVDDFANAYKLQMLSTLTQALQAEQMAVVLIHIHPQFDLHSAITDADQRQIDALVLLGTEVNAERLSESALPASHPPLFLLAGESTFEHIPAISCDVEASMTQINHYLWTQGYRQPGLLSGPNATALQRKNHFMKFWQSKLGGLLPELLAANYTSQAAAQALRRYWLETPAPQRIDVLICESDTLAIGALETARHELGLKVPADLAIVGYDGDPLTGSPSFDLTTYQQPMAQMVETLVAMLKGRIEPQPVSIIGELVVRGSA